MDLLMELAEAGKLKDKMNCMKNGDHINQTEDRAVLHTALRCPKTEKRMVDGIDVIPQVHDVLEKIALFSEKVRTGEWIGATGKELTTVVAIGIGGSFLGPEFVYEALKTEKQGAAGASGRTLRFLANVDPVDVARALTGLDAESTLVIVVSKTFTTAETMLNARTIKDWLIKNVPADAVKVIMQHMIAGTTAVDKATAFGISAENCFGFWDWVGGRFSVCSAVGMLPLSIHYGYTIMQQFLDGANDMDNHFFSAPFDQNIPVLFGLLGIWNSSFMEYNARAILPYAQCLTRFAAHIQQVDMESNGKRVAMDGTILPFEVGEIVFGEPGTNGQHSFYQLIHQGRIIPCEFIGFCNSPNPISLDGEKVSNHDELMSNFFAQPDALAYGKTIDQLKSEGVPEHLLQHKEFPGNRPSLSLLFGDMNAFTCGQLLAIYEHRVAVQGFVWGINSFDQWGVQLGKALADKVRPTLSANRKSGGNVSEADGFCPSTAALINRYLATSSK